LHLNSCVPSFTLPKNKRLTSSRIQAVFEQGTFIRTAHFTLALLQCPLDCIGCVVIIGKKKIRRAHDRNRVRRIVKEYIRVHQHTILPCDIVVLPQSSAQLLTNELLREAFAKTWKRSIAMRKTF